MLPWVQGNFLWCVWASSTKNHTTAATDPKAVTTVGKVADEMSLSDAALLDQLTLRFRGILISRGGGPSQKNQAGLPLCPWEPSVGPVTGEHLWGADGHQETTGGREKRDGDDVRERVCWVFGRLPVLISKVPVLWVLSPRLLEGVVCFPTFPRMRRWVQRSQTSQCSLNKVLLKGPTMLYPGQSPRLVTRPQGVME